MTEFELIDDGNHRPVAAKQGLPAVVYVLAAFGAMVGLCCLLTVFAALMAPKDEEREEVKARSHKEESIEEPKGEVRKKPLSFEGLSGFQVISLLLGGDENDAIANARKLGEMGRAARPAVTTAAMLTVVDDDEHGGARVSEAFLRALEKVAPLCPVERDEAMAMARSRAAKDNGPETARKIEKLIRVLKEAGAR